MKAIPSQESAEDNAAVVTTDDANQLLVSAAMMGDVVQVEAALKWGADVNHAAEDQGFKTPLHLAACAGHGEVVEALLDAGADAERIDAQSQTPLASAIINEQPQSARILAARVPETIPAGVSAPQANLEGHQIADVVPATFGGGHRKPQIPR